MPIADRIKSNPALKKLVHRLLLPKDQARPRLWVRLLLNRFFHKRGSGSIIRWRTRIDVLPFNRFELGAKSVIEDFCTINNGVGHVLIGANSLVGMGNVIIGPVTIGNNVILAQHIVASGLNHEYRNPDVPIKDQNITTALITIEDDCWIGANVVLTAGVTVGRHSVVAAGAVVTKDIPPYTIAVGNPARAIKKYDHESGEWVKI